MSVNKPSLVNQKIYVNGALNPKPVADVPEIEPKSSKKKLAVGIAAAAGIGALVLGGILYAKKGKSIDVNVKTNNISNLIPNTVVSNPVLPSNNYSEEVYSYLKRGGSNSSKGACKICKDGITIVCDILSDKPRIKGVADNSLSFVFTEKRFIAKHPQGRLSAKRRIALLNRCIDVAKTEIEKAKRLGLEGADKISEKLPEFLEKFEGQI